MTSATNDSVNKEALITLLRQLSAHSLYPVASIHEWLTDCGVEVQAAPATKGLQIFGETIKEINGDWGSGIYPPHLLYAVIEHHGLNDALHTEMTGRGFAYNDLVEQLSTLWEISK